MVGSCIVVQSTRDTLQTKGIAANLKRKIGTKIFTAIPLLSAPPPVWSFWTRLGSEWVSEHWVSFDKMPSEKESRDIPLKKWEFYACVLLPEWCRFEETFWGRTSRCLELNLGWCGTRLAQSWCFHLAWSTWVKRASLIIQGNLVEMRNNQYSAQTVNRSEWGHVLRWDS